MCGIFAYAGQGSAVAHIINGLQRLEYRGYDSWGLAVANGRGLEVFKSLGEIDCKSIEVELTGATIGIGHTRWATHGAVTWVNAHPHLATDKSFVLVHNGIVENYQQLKAELILDGHYFESQTDTEVIVRLIEQQLATSQHCIAHSRNDSQLREALRVVFSKLKGRNTIMVLSEKDQQIVAIRHGSPLVIGIGDNEKFFASDSLSFADRTNSVIYTKDLELVECQTGQLKIYDVLTGSEKEATRITLDHGDISVTRDGYAHYMLKEIFEQRSTILSAAFAAANNSASSELQLLSSLAEEISQARAVYTVGAGGAYYTAEQIAFQLRTINGVNALALRAYEIEAYLPLIQPGDVAIAVSQSGETADTIEALEHLKAKGATIASVVNMAGSTIGRMSDYAFSSRSGPEICVLSTKSSSAQMVFGYLLAKTIKGEQESALDSVATLSSSLENYLTEELVTKTGEIAAGIKDCAHLFVLGKGPHYAAALIGALNIKEASYIHAEGFAAGELKHGVIALIEDRVPVIVFVDDDQDRDYMIGVAAEVKARGAFVIGLGCQPNELFDEFIPLAKALDSEVGLPACIIPCQLLAYHLAVLNSRNPDRPRNLAKSVTVK